MEAHEKGYAKGEIESLLGKFIEAYCQKGGGSAWLSETIREQLPNIKSKELAAFCRELEESVLRVENFQQDISRLAKERSTSAETWFYRKLLDNDSKDQYTWQELSKLMEKANRESQARLAQITSDFQDPALISVDYDAYMELLALSMRSELSGLTSLEGRCKKPPPRRFSGGT